MFTTGFARFRKFVWFAIRCCQCREIGWACIESVKAVWRASQLALYIHRISGLLGRGTWNCRCSGLRYGHGLLFCSDLRVNSVCVFAVVTECAIASLEQSTLLRLSGCGLSPRKDGSFLLLVASQLAKHPSTIHNILWNCLLPRKVLDVDLHGGRQMLEYMKATI